jgi:hypothetical protein
MVPCVAVLLRARRAAASSSSGRVGRVGEQKGRARTRAGWSTGSTGTDGNQHHQHHSSTAPAHDRRAATYSRIAFSSASFPRVGQGLQYALRARQPAPLTVLGACDDQRLASVLGLAPLSLTCRTARAPIRPSLCLSLHLHLHLHPHPQPCVCRAWPAKSPLLHSHTLLSPPPPLIARCPLTLLPSSPPRRCRHHSSPTPNTQHPTANIHHPLPSRPATTSPSISGRIARVSRQIPDTFGATVTLLPAAFLSSLSFNAPRLPHPAIPLQTPNPPASVLGRPAIHLLCTHPSMDR